MRDYGPVITTAFQVKKIDRREEQRRWEKQRVKWHDGSLPPWVEVIQIQVYASEVFHGFTHGLGLMEVSRFWQRGNQNADMIFQKEHVWRKVHLKRLAAV